MTKNQEEELISIVKDNNKMLKDIWNILNNPTKDLKDFIINVFANVISNQK